ncbi:MAG: SpoIIE family protein phosphatase [Desulfovibrio sp.]|jgi:sigma-B regulation protein RsbU (phosphoserine phosphatase)|nr:SpoIIE family protein phosphatase [Desulfovibrio sp.]
MTFSLRSKLFILVLASIALAVVPVISFTYRDLRESNAELEREAFGNVIVLMEDNIGSRYLGHLTNKVMDVLLRKDQLRRYSQLARSAWQDVAGLPGDARQRFIANWIERLGSFGVHMDIFDAHGAPRAGTPQLALLSARPDMTDFKGRPVGSLLSLAQLSSDGEFAVFDTLPGSPGPGGTSGAGSTTEPLLVYFLPMPEADSVVVSAMLLSDIERQALYNEQQIIRSTQEKFQTLSLGNSGFIALVSGKGELLAHHGNPKGREVALIPPRALAEAREKGRTESIADTGPAFGVAIFRAAYFKALDWYVVSAAPQAEIEAPTNALVRKLAFIALAAVLVSAVGTLLLTARLIAPLRALTGRAHALAETDFSAPDAEALTADGLPTSRSDEVGQLARAFTQMGRALARNVRALMDTTAVKERMQGELNAARDIQMGILPAPGAAPKQAGYAASALLEPAKEVGGDLYDFFVAPDGRQVVVIGDVSGKGVPAALFMSMAVTLCRYAVASGLAPGAAMTRINAQLAANNPGCMFVTLLIGLFDPATGALEFANGGHCPPCVTGPDAEAPRELPGISGPLVGAMEDMAYETLHAVIAPGERCLLYTDGVAEAMNERLELFDMPRLMDVLHAHRGDTPAGILRALHEATVAFRGTAEQSDDITMLCFTREVA